MNKEKTGYNTGIKFICKRTNKNDILVIVKKIDCFVDHNIRGF